MPIWAIWVAAAPAAVDEVAEASAVPDAEVAVAVAEPEAEALDEVEADPVYSVGSRLPQLLLMVLVQLDWPAWLFSFSSIQSL